MSLSLNALADANHFYSSFFRNYEVSKTIQRKKNESNNTVYSICKTGNCVRFKIMRTITSRD